MIVKLPLDGCIYTRTTGRVINTNLFQINLGELFFRATQSQARLTFLNCSWNGQLGLHQNQCTFHSLREGLIHERKPALLAPPPPPYVCKQLTALFHTQPPLKSRFYSIAAQTVNCIFQLKPSPVLQALGHCHQLGLAYGRKTWAYPMNTLFATVAFLLLLDTNLLPQAGSTHYSQLPTLQHSTKLLCFFCLFF